VKGVAGAARRFPRVAVGRAESLEAFVERHSPKTGRFAWNSPRTADLLAFLASQVAPAAVLTETSRDLASSDAIRIPEEVGP
jgi:hypothetical protein